MKNLPIYAGVTSLLFICAVPFIKHERLQAQEQTKNEMLKQFEQSEEKRIYMLYSADSYEECIEWSATDAEICECIYLFTEGTQQDTLLSNFPY